ncbi:delta-endotoxin CytB [Schizophyllum commune]
MASNDATNEAQLSGEAQVLGDARVSPFFDQIIRNLNKPLLDVAGIFGGQVGRFVHAIGPQRFFNWGIFRKAINSYQGESLSGDIYKQTPIQSKKRSVASIAAEIADIIRAGHEDALSSTLLSNRLEATFTNLKNGKETDWLDFKDGSGRTSWEYRLLLAIPEGDAEEKFRAFVTTIKLEADLDEASWLTLVNDSTHNFSATIDVLNIVVLKSFSDKNPLQ